MLKFSVPTLTLGSAAGIVDISRAVVRACSIRAKSPTVWPWARYSTGVLCTKKRFRFQPTSKYKRDSGCQLVQVYAARLWN